MLPSPDFRRQGTAVLRSSTAQQLIPACHHSRRAWLSKSQASSYTLQHAPHAQHADSSDTSNQEAKYRGVSKVGNKWRAYINIPKHLQPSTHGRKMIVKHGFHHPEAAARIADIMQLAYHGEAAYNCLNFPRSNYSDQQVAELRAELLAKQAAPSMQVRIRDNDPSGLKAAVAAAAERVAGLHDGSRELVGYNQEMDGTVKVKIRAKETKRYQLSVRTIIEAACAYDLLRMAMYGPTYSVNFPPVSYDSSWVEAAARDIELVRPGMLAAAQVAPAPPDYYCLETGRAADAAVAAEAAAAGAAELDDSNKAVHCHTHKGSSARASIWGRWQGFKGSIHFSRFYDASTASAACAADLMLLSLGRPAANLPSHKYKDSSIAAMRAWMQLEASRQAAWAAKKEQIERPSQPKKEATGKQLGRG